MAFGNPARAWAQDASDTQQRGLPKPVVDENTPVAFEADRVEYESKDNVDLVTASGNVVRRQNQPSVRTDTVTWDRTT
jgi:lipopolysaccharide export system protein LptA